METVVLYDWADTIEGTVRTEEWGWCTSSTCNHVSHDPAFSYPVTLIEDAEVLWRGQRGEMLVKTPLGRIMLTKYWEGDTEADRRYRPEMWTVELTSLGQAMNVLDSLLAADWHYRSPRHEALVAYRKACVQAFAVEEGVEV